MRLLFEAGGLPRVELPSALTERYGGDLALGDELVYANFVSSIDGVVAFGDKRESGGIISGKNDDDRFLMGLLRACSDVVLIGASTLRAEPRHVLWTPEFIYPSLKEEFAELRQSLGKQGPPRLAVVTSQSKLDTGHQALRDALVIAPAKPGARVTPPEILARLRGEGYRRILCEGGPTLFGQLVGAGLVNELFLTVSPVLAGRDFEERRDGLMQGMALPASGLRRTSLRSVRASGSYLFLQYGFSATAG